MTYVSVQTLPNIIVDNNTNQTIVALAFWFEGMTIAEPTIKKIRPNEREQATIYTRSLVGTKTLFMKHADSNNQIQSYPIFTALTNKYWSNILVEINGVNDNGLLDLKITPNFG